ncbi:MAG: hypothetical protein ACE5HI_20115 [bacterium]
MAGIDQRASDPEFESGDGGFLNTHRCLKGMAGGGRLRRYSAKDWS